MYRTKDHLAYFSERKNGWCGRHLLPEIYFGSNWPRWSEIADFRSIFARSASAVTSSEKSSIITNRKSTTRFPVSLPWSTYVAPKFPKGGDSKTQNGRFFCKIALLLKTVCYKVSLCENCQRQRCRTFICLTIHAKIWLVGTSPFSLPEILDQTDRLGAKSPIFDLFSPVAPQP